MHVDIAVRMRIAMHEVNEMQVEIFVHLESKCTNFGHLSVCGNCSACGKHGACENYRVNGNFSVYDNCCAWRNFGARRIGSACEN